MYTYGAPGNQYFIIEWSNVRTENYNSLNSFQVILYNQTAPPYDDNEIKLQYKTFNNTSSGSFSGYTPIHGGYATIGLENHTSDIGLEYSFNDDYPTAAMELDELLYLSDVPLAEGVEIPLLTQEEPNNEPIVAIRLLRIAEEEPEEILVEGEEGEEGEEVEGAEATEESAQSEGESSDTDSKGDKNENS